MAIAVDICAEANRWKNDVSVVKLPTLLEGDALAVFTEIGEDERKDYPTLCKRHFIPWNHSSRCSNNSKKGNCFLESLLACSCTV